MRTNTATNHYGALAAEIYDLDKPVGSMPDMAFHVERFARFRGSILEPACGTGRALVPLLEAGCAVTGFDPSAWMLEQCRARCADRGFAPPLSQQRFEDFHFEQAFDAVFVPAGSFTLIDNFDTAIVVLARFRGALAAGGLLVIDLDPLRSMTAEAQTHRSWTAANGDLITLEWTRVKTDWLAQRLEAIGRYERWRGGALVETELMRWAQRLWGFEEFRLALAAAGLEGINAIGGYERGRSPRASDRIWTFEATR